MRNTTRLTVLAGVALTAVLGVQQVLQGQNLPNPYRIVDGWAQLPGGRAMGAVGKVVTDPDGRHIWAVVRCDRLEDPARFGDECRDSKSDPVIKFGPDGKVVKSFGGGMFIWPHGLAIDPDGNVWVTDAVAANRAPRGDMRGQQVVKFSPEGKVLMRLGRAGVAGSGPDHFNVSVRSSHDGDRQGAGRHEAVAHDGAVAVRCASVEAVEGPAGQRPQKDATDGEWHGRLARRRLATKPRPLGPSAGVDRVAGLRVPGVPPVRH
jgi:hypothetical protein